MLVGCFISVTSTKQLEGRKICSNPWLLWSAWLTGSVVSGSVVRQESQGKNDVDQGFFPDGEKGEIGQRRHWHLEEAIVPSKHTLNNILSLTSTYFWKFLSILTNSQVMNLLID